MLKVGTTRAWKRRMKSAINALNAGNETRRALYEYPRTVGRARSEETYRYLSTRWSSVYFLPKYSFPSPIPGEDRYIFFPVMNATSDRMLWEAGTMCGTKSCAVVLSYSKCGRPQSCDPLLKSAYSLLNMFCPLMFRVEVGQISIRRR